MFQTMQPGRDMMIFQFIDTAHDYGLELHVCYADMLEDMNDMGIDGILTKQHLSAG